MEKLSKKEKILLGISILGVGATSYLCYKYGIENNKLKNRVKVLEEVVSEDVLEEAIATTTRKLNYRLDKIKVYETRTDIDSKAKLKEHLYFKELFETRLKSFNELKSLRYLE